MTAVAEDYAADYADELAAMTISELRGLAETDLADFAAAEVRRRAADRARVRRRDNPVTAQWHEAAYAQYLAADEACRGQLLKPRARELRGSGERQIKPWPDLWTGPRWMADQLASEELQDFWDVYPRITRGTVADALRSEEEEYHYGRDQLASDDGGRIRPGRETGAGGDVPCAGSVRNAGHVRGPGPGMTAPDETEPPADVDFGEFGAMRGEFAEILPSYADVTPLDQEWLWEGYIPTGKVTLIAGDSGIGKGFMLSDLAARVSTGDDMPDGSPGNPPGHVIMITPEDDPRTCTVHRLRSHGADLAMVHDLTIVNGNVWCIQEDINELRRQIAACGGAALVVIDPISAVTLVGLTSDVPVRRKVLGPLEAVARETGCAIVVIGHLTKTGAAAAQKNRSAAKDGMGGTKGLSNAAWIMLTVVRDDADPRIRTLAVVKSNGTDDKAGAAVRYTITGAPPRVEWLGEAGEVPGKGDGQEAAVLRAMRDLGPGPHHMRQVAAKAAVPYDSARMAASRLERKGELSHRGHAKSGLYELASAVDALEREVTQLAARRAPDPVLPLPQAWAELAKPAPWYQRSQGWPDAPQ